MHYKLLWVTLIVLPFSFFTNITSAQTNGVDTIVVNLSGTEKKTNTAEPTPALNLDALRQQIREDSIRIEEIRTEKLAAEKKRLEEQKEQRVKEKEEKEAEQKAEAEQRKQEKEARENALTEKKAAEKAAKEKAIADKKERKVKDTLENKIAENTTPDTGKTPLTSTDANESSEEQKSTVNETVITDMEGDTQEENQQAQKQQNTDETNSVPEEVVEQQATELAEKTLQKSIEEIHDDAIAPASSVSEEVNVPTQTVDSPTPETPVIDLPKVPKGVIQEDNSYGTVRLAFDDNAASFLLSIPKETKMHYHKDHSEHIMLIEGEGMVLMGYKTIKLKKNELIFVTKGTPHKIINSGRDKLKVLSIQSPFFDGSDIIFLE